MGIFDGCLITSDVDDTLVSTGWINPKNVEKIEFFLNEGGMFSVATGRTANAISTVTKALKRFSPSIVANGCMIYDYSENKVLYSVSLPPSDHKILKEVIDRGLNVGVEVHSGYTAFAMLRNSESDFHQQYEGFEAVSCDYNSIDSLEWNKVVFLSENRDEYEKIRKIAKEIGVKSKFVDTRLVHNGTEHHFLELVPNGVSKATAIKELCKLFKIKKGNSFAIGDYYNDVEMLKNADVAAVTSGAPDDIKSIADYITVSCEEGAVADFIDYLTEIHKTV